MTWPKGTKVRKWTKNVKMSEKILESKCLVTYTDFDDFRDSKFPNFSQKLLYTL